MNHPGKVAMMTRAIERSLRNLPALPQAVMKVLDETNKVDASAAKVEEYVLTDQALTAKVLRVVNSAYYGLSGQVTSVSQAIVILGLQQIRNLVLSVGCLSAFEVSSKRQQETLQRFWLHAFATASATSLIAAEKGLDVRSREVAFVGGLLHDVGRLFLFTNFTDAYDRLQVQADEKGIPVDSLEEGALGMGHAAIGERMATAWHLPTVLVELIARHEGPFTLEDDPLVYTVHLGDAITKHLYGGVPSIDPIVDEVVANWYGLDASRHAALSEAVSGKASGASSLYGLMAA